MKIKYRVPEEKTLNRTSRLCYTLPNTKVLLANQHLKQKYVSCKTFFNVENIF